MDLAAPFLQILSTNGQHNSFTFLRVQHILAILLAASYGRASSSPAARAAAAVTLTEAEEKAQRLTVVQFLRYLISKITNLSNSSSAPAGASSSYPSSPTSSAAANNRELMACLGALKNLLRSSERIQELFAEQDGVRAITTLLNKETQNAQLLYLVGFNIWLLSYHKAIAIKLKEFGVIKKLVSIVKVNVMEKVIRIGFSILRVRGKQETSGAGDVLSSLRARASAEFFTVFLFLCVCVSLLELLGSQGRCLQRGYDRSRLGECGGDAVQAQIQGPRYSHGHEQNSRSAA